MLQSLQCERGVKKYIAAIIAEGKKGVQGLFEEPQC